MVSEFHQLSDKITQLAELMQSVRRENAELRTHMAALSAENADLSTRVQEAYRRVATLLEKIPVPDENNEETA